MSKRFILRYRPKGEIPPEEVESIAQLPDVSIADRSVKMLFVEGPEANLQAYVSANSQWTLFPETTYTVPDARYKLKES